MLIAFGYDISLRLELETAVLFSLKVHPSRWRDLVEGENFRIEPKSRFEEYLDRYGNRCGRVHCQPGVVRFSNRGLIWDSGELDAFAPHAREVEISRLPTDVLIYLLASRYCETDSELSDIAWAKFAGSPAGWARVQAICDFVHSHIKFDYLKARANRTAREACHERVGVCRDFAHLAIALCRCMNIPARYVTGYLEDIGVRRHPIRWVLAPGWRSSWMAGGLPLILDTIAGGLPGCRRAGP